MVERKPNILLVQADQLTATALAAYGNAVCHTPNIDRMAEEGVVFEQAYCNFPLCAPSRFSMMTGQLASRIGAFDNAAELPASIPTFAHYLRVLGYRTCLSGKMHFVGPDQLHGFEERLTSDIYPTDFLWAADWTREDHDDVADLRLVTCSGPCAGSVQIDYDDAVANRAALWLRDHAVDRERPFFLTVSFTHPHDPFVCTEPYWRLYDGVEIDPPRVAALDDSRHDAHSRRLLSQSGLRGVEIGEESILNARRGYYGAISYLDARLGELLAVLQATKCANDTVVIFTSDHGEMLGERGMWLKKNFFEPAMRIPFLFHAPFLFGARRVSEVVSLIDLLPTLLALAGGGAAAEPVEPLDGIDLIGLLTGGREPTERPLLGEILSEGTPAPLFLVRRGRYKYVSCPIDPPQLYDLENDPDELENLAGRPELSEVETAFAAEVADSWDVNALAERVRLSQRRRLLIRQSHATGRRPDWDFLPEGESNSQWFRGQSSYGDWAYDYRLVEA